MAILSNLLSVSEPKGVWITIIKAFEAVTNNYVLAILFLTVVIKVLWSLVIEPLQTLTQQKMTASQSKMQPEIEKVEKKYAKQPEILQQKKNEVYKKYQGKQYFGSCFVMLIATALNMLIFFTLFAGLQTMASYKNSVSYDNTKYAYVNCINVTDKYLNANIEGVSYEDKLAYFEDYEKLSFEVRDVEVSQGEEKTTKKVVDIVYGEGESAVTLYTTDYKYEKDFETEVTVPPEKEGEEATTKIVVNENIIPLIQKYMPVYEEGEEVGSKEIKVWTYTTQGEDGQQKIETLYFSTALQNVAMKHVFEVYDENTESFLWVKNIWIADSPLSKSVLSYDTLKKQVGSKNFEENEETIYNAFMTDLKEDKSTANGYFIIPILIVAVPFLTNHISKVYMRKRNEKKGLPPLKQNAGWMQIILPIVFGLFAFLYNTVFSIYLLTGQIVSMIFKVPLLMFAHYFIDKQDKKKEEANKVTVDYSRKF